MSDYPFKTTTYHVDSAGSLAMSGSGTLRSIGIETADGMIEFELGLHHASTGRVETA